VGRRASGRRLPPQVRLDSPLALPTAAPVLPEKHFEQIANLSLLCLLREGMTQRYLGLHLVDVSARVAGRKGHSFWGYFLFSLVFFPAALIVAYLVQDRTVLVQDRPAPTPT
jgi:hypothetical protein